MRKPSEYASQLTLSAWLDFSKRLEAVSRNSYCGDINEYMDFCRKDLLETKRIDADRYYEYLLSKVRDAKMKATTMGKKIREIHKFSEYIAHEKAKYQAPGVFEDFFYEYLIRLVSADQLVSPVPVEHLDALLKVAESNPMYYTMLVLFGRMGLSSTEVCALKPNDLVSDPNGVFIILRESDEMRYVPEDAAAVLEHYLSLRKDCEYLFYNRSQNKLNVQYCHLMMKKLTKEAGVPGYSARDLRNTCGSILFAYGAKPEQVATQLGITQMHIKRYDNVLYTDNLSKTANDLVKIKIEPPGI